MSFNGEIALISGGASGIGKGITQKLLDRDAICIVLGRDSRKFGELTNEMYTYTNRVHFYETDVRDPDSVNNSINQIIHEFTRIDMLVNSAGTNIRKPALEYTFDEWRTIIDTNLTGTFLVSQAVARHMKDHGGGRMVNIGSMISHYGVPNVAPYGASKGGINQLTKVLAVEWAQYGIRVNQVSPGYIETPLGLQVFSKGKYRDKIIERTPLKRLGQPKDIADMTAFLLSAEAEFVTGQIIAVDGGILGGDPTLDPLQV